MSSKPHRGVAMEGGGAHWYNARARRERDEFKALARRIAETLPRDAAILEVAPGPGYLAIELAKLGMYKITGLDISETFVRIASENAEREGVKVDFRQGDVASLPFEGGTFDTVFCRAAFQNFSQPLKALHELRRVLKVGGTAVVIELRRDVSSSVINQHLRKVTANLWDWLTNQLVFRLILVERAYTEDQLKRFVSASGLRILEIRQGPMFLELWLSNAVDSYR